MEPISQAVAPWQSFYTLTGTASATMIGLLFVAATLSSGVFSADRRAALRVFLTASVVNFSLILAASLIFLAPVRDWHWLGGMVLGCGLIGMGYSVLTVRDTLHDGLIVMIDLEDRTWYVVMPIAGYLALAGSGMTLAWGLDLGCTAVALSMGVLLTVGIRNAWDITLWSMGRRRQEIPSPGAKTESEQDPNSP